MNHFNSKHDHARKGKVSPTYQSWKAMLARCHTPSNASYHRYGGRGITVCQRWKSFENFYADMGERPLGTSLDRKDNDGNYEPGNCCWATDLDQNRNRSNIHKVALNGVTKTLVEWSEQCGIAYQTLYERVIRKGWEPSLAFTTPPADSRFKKGKIA